MESKEVRSSVISRPIRFNGLFQPLHQDNLRVIDRQNEPKRFNRKSNSGFTVIPSNELRRDYIQKPDLLASKGVIHARDKPPHYQKTGSRTVGLKMYGEMANHRKFGRRFDLQNLNLKSNLRPKIGKKDNSQRRFSPLGFGSDSQLRDRKKGQYISFEKKSNEIKKLCDDNQKKDKVVREVGSKLMVSTSRDSVLSLERNRFAEDVKFRHISSSSFVSKDETEDLAECSNASPGCQTNSEEAYQPSPVSVLEPIFSDDMFDDIEELPYLDIHGLEKELDALKSESDSYSDGSGMEVSSDEESVIASETKESKNSEPIELKDTQESRDSSYIDDILNEVLLIDKNWVPDKLDSVITFKDFEKMEKKYYTETSRKRSERRILFDRVNAGLVEILQSFTATPTWKKPVSMRLGAGLSTCGLKQELFKVLARQEKRAKKESFNKVPVIYIEEWLELEADDESVVCELESMIVDELLVEIVSFM